MLIPLPKSNRSQNLRSGSSKLVRQELTPAPLRGLTSQMSVAKMGPDWATSLRNMVPKPLGLEMRHGSQLWQNTLEARINTLISYQAGNPVDSRMFAATFEGFYDVSSRVDNAVKPTPSLTFPVQTVDVTDTWSWVPFATQGENFVACASEFNGYYTYDATNGWVNHPAGVAPGEIDGADPLSFDYVMSWKRRLWFIPQHGTKVFYLPVNQIAGTVQEFDFGPYMRQGGEVKQLVSWTRDGGDGLDDFLVVIGSEGDVILYQGTDPANADTFSMVGIWDVGRVPQGRRIARKAGGDVEVMCESGLVPLSQVFQGTTSLLTPEALGYPIQATLATEASRSISAEQWELHYFAKEELFIVKEPVDQVFIDPQMYAVNLHSRGWCTLNELPQQTIGEFNGDLFSGDTVGNVWQILIGDVDGLDFQSASTDIKGYVQTGFTNYDSVSSKKAQICQPTFQATAAPAVQIQMKTEFDFAPIPGSPTFSGDADGGVWDVDNWDEAVWAGALQTFQAKLGVNGVGYYLSLAMAVRGTGGTVFTNWLLTFEEGSIL